MKSLSMKIRAEEAKVVLGFYIADFYDIVITTHQIEFDPKLFLYLKLPVVS